MHPLQHRMQHPPRTLCRTPEEEDVEVHPDGVALFADADGLQDARVPQLTADQLVLKHASLLRKKTNKQKHNSERAYQIVCLHLFGGDAECEHLPSSCLA